MDLTTPPPPKSVRKRPLSDFYSCPTEKKNSYSGGSGDAGGDRKKQVCSERKKEVSTRAVRIFKVEDDEDEGGLKKAQMFSFRVLMPNGTTVEMKILEPPSHEMPLDKFFEAVRTEYLAVSGRTEPQKRPINWNSPDLYVLDPFDRKFRGLDFRNLNPRKSYLLRLRDGSDEAEIFENMWDLTPDTELLRELPEEYSFESALADLIDNSLQAVWSNNENERRLISLKLYKDRISIFDTGPGMDGSEKNSIAKWGKMGASLHRSSKGEAIGGKPPYLKPYFGMFGYGGTIASMHLGRKAIVSSKTKKSNKVYILHLERDSLLSCSSSEKTWRTNGGLRDPLDSEIQESPHGSFTKVEIFDPRMRIRTIKILQGKLKDIYFPYIQCDEISGTGRTMMPTEFQVHDTNLAEIMGGEVAITNLFSCNGPDFIFELHFASDTSSTGGIAHQEANARLKFVYFPVTQGKESIERIIEKLNEEGYETLENFESFCRVSVRRLGRLLPDARLKRLPFMESKQRKGETLKRCSHRIKCFIDTDAGFNPTPAKTNLAQCNPFTIALKNFGNQPCEKDVHVKIFKDGKELTLSQLEKEYHEWILKMHDKYDFEIESGGDEPIIVLDSTIKKMLGTSSDVLRVHKIIQWKGIAWKSGQRIKILKGACAGFHKGNTFAILEFIILERCEGDGGEAWIICRPMGVPNEDGCSLSIDKGNAHLDLRESKILPFSVIDSKKCVPVDDADWECQLKKYQQKTTPSSIELLDAKYFLDLKMDEMLPDDVVDAGHDPPEEILAIVRPASFNSTVASQKMDQKYILKEIFEMSLNVKFLDSDGNEQNPNHVYSIRTKPLSYKGLNGVYVFPLRMKIPDLFHKAGLYSFIFSLNEASCATYEKTVRVQALSESKSWEVLSKNSTKYIIRVGESLPSISIACYDRFKNRIPFKQVSDVVIKLRSDKGDFAYDYAMNSYLSRDKLTLMVKGLLFDTSELDKIGPSYETTLSICSEDELFSVALQVQVLPGAPHHVRVSPLNFGQKMFPGLKLKELKLEIFDEDNNHIQKDEEIQIQMDGFCAHEQGCLQLKVDANGCINLGGMLKVTAGYGKKASLSVYSHDKAIFKQEFQIETREMRVASEIPEFCLPGSHLENVIFEVINSEGEVDENIHDDDKNGQNHTLSIVSEMLSIDDTVRYSFRHGRCTVRSISLPEDEGKFKILAVHSRHKELKLDIEVNVNADINMQESEVDGKDTLKKKLEGKVRHYAQRSGKSAKKRQILTSKQSNIDLEVFSTEAESMDLNASQSSRCTQESILEHIYSRSDSAAAIACKLIEAPLSVKPYRDFFKEIYGVVALLGLVESYELSRILAEYLGEKQMLAVVIKTHADTSANGFSSSANYHGIYINGGYDMICLDDIRPYKGEVTNDPQRRLAIAKPTLPNGESPPGFLGYAVNMMHLSAEHLRYRTASGHGIRETLFYRLFGELQVYTDRDCMSMASSWFENIGPAVSLDGVIMRGNGVTSHVFGDPSIMFPVTSSEKQLVTEPSSAKSVRVKQEAKGGSTSKT